MNIQNIYAQFSQTNATFENLALDRDGNCSEDGTITLFVVDAIFTGGTDYQAILVDGNNKILDIVAGSIEQPNNQLFFAVLQSNTVGPYTILATNDLSSDIGSIFTGSIVDTPLSFDPSALDPDCPGIQPIPTLSQWGIIALSMIMLILGLVFMKQTKAVFG